MKDNRYGSHSVTRPTAHIVWVTKHRYPVLRGDIQKRCREQIIQIRDAEDARILTGVVSKDHVHIHIEYPPSKPVSDLVKGFKGRASRLLQHEHPALQKQYWGRHFRAIGYVGASKRIMELILRAMSTPQTQMVSVRFGNVIGSRGSAVELFTEQVGQRKVVTVTHPEATRYFWATEETVNLLLLASWLGSDGEVLVPELGPAIRILDVAEQLIRCAGLAPHRDVKIVFTGLRPGEKLREEMVSDHEPVDRTDNNGIRKVTPPRLPVDVIEQWLTELRDALTGRDLMELIRKIRQLVPEYRPDPSVEKGKES